MADQNVKCACNSGVRVVFPCSGAADVGEVADRAARKISKLQIAKMFCLAGIGGNVSGMIASTKGAERVLVIDGCGQECARKTMAERGISDIVHLRVCDVGLPKGQSPANNENIDLVVDKGIELLG